MNSNEIGTNRLHKENKSKKYEGRLVNHKRSDKEEKMTKIKQTNKSEGIINENNET